MSNSVYDYRLTKRNNWIENKKEKYPSRFEKTHNAINVKTLIDGEYVSFAGRLIKIRNLGRITFLQIKDHTESVQVSLDINSIGKQEYTLITSNLDIGDYIGVAGKVYTTKTQEKTIKIDKCSLLSKALRPLPEQYGGLNDPESRIRQRYLDLLANEETWKRFELRNNLIKFIRGYLEKNDFFEVETPVLQPVATGASARPFVTHHHTMDIDLFLRIAHEPYLKRLMVGGYERIFEIGKCFRNEGIDPSRLQEFTLLEYYAAYWDYKDNMKFMQTMIQDAVKSLKGSYKVEYQDKLIDFQGEWPEITFRDLLVDYTGIDINIVTSLDSLKNEIKSKELDIDVNLYVSYSSLLDALYKKFSRPNIIQPTFVTRYPTELVCLSRRCDDDPSKLELFQLVVNSWELIKAYSELVDPIEQSERFNEQTRLIEAGDEEAMMADEEYVLCMEYGMPIMSGIGLGIDRLLGILTNVKNIRDTIYFPPVRPIDRNELNQVEKFEKAKTTNN